MTPTQLADYVADNMPETQPEIEEFTARLGTKVNALPVEIKGWIYDAIESVLQDVVCKKHPPAPTP